MKLVFWSKKIVYFVFHKPFMVSTVTLAIAGIWSVITSKINFKIGTKILGRFLHSTLLCCKTKITSKKIPHTGEKASLNRCG